MKPVPRAVLFLCYLSAILTRVICQQNWPLPECTKSCPLKLAIQPCNCTKDEYDFRKVKIGCTNLTSVGDLVNSMRNLAGYCVDVVTIATSNIGHLPSNLFLNTRIKDIQIRDTPLTHFTQGQENAFLGLENHLEYLSMRRCGLHSHMRWYRLTNLNKLVSLDLTSNNINEITEDWFLAPPRNLRLLYLKKNGISKIDNSAFASMKLLSVIDLSENNITDIKRSMFPPVAKSLTFIYLSYNKISHLPDDIFTNMPNLKRLYLDFNRIQILSEGAFYPVWSNLQYLDLMGNKMHCDCSMLWMTKLSAMPKFFYGNCDFPLALRRKPLAEIWPWHIENSSKVPCTSSQQFSSQGRTSYDKWFNIYRKSVITKYNGRRPMQVHHKAFKRAKYSELPDNEVYLG